MKRLILISLIFVTGCAPRFTWNKTNGTYSEFAKDNASCTYEAKKATASYYTPNSLVDGFDMVMRQIEIHNLCLEGMGYYKEAIR